MKTAMSLLTLSVMSCAASAGAETGGFTGPDNLQRVTVAQAVALPDDTNVRVTGYIVRSLGDEEYEFRDETGTLRVEIDDDDWRGLEITPDDLVELSGEIEQESDGAELEAESIRLADGSGRQQPAR